MRANSIKKELIHVRNSEYGDIDQLVKVGIASFPGMETFSYEKFKSHLDVFPEGQFCVEYNGVIIGSCSSMRLNFDEFTAEDDFNTVTDNGYIRNHNPIGLDLYGVEVVIHPDYRGLKLGGRLYEERRKLCKKLNLKRIVFGGRIPNYYKYASEMTAEEYVQEVLRRNYYDATLTFQLKEGFTFQRVIPNYIPDDSESMGYATLLEWKNPDYKPEP